MSDQQLTKFDVQTELTRDALIKAALKRFADEGFEAASLRSIVNDADQNISSIKYHFGSKEGLYDACVEAVARRMTFEGPGEMLGLLCDEPDTLSADEACGAIRVIVGAVIRDAQKPTSKIESKFLRRELILGTRGTSLFLKRVLGDHIDLMAALVVRAENLTAGSSAARLRALAIIGQTTFFLTACSLTRKAMGWDRMGDHVPELIDAIYPMKQDVKAIQ